MAILTLNISNSKITGLKRSLDVIAINITSDAIILHTIVNSLDNNGNIINTQEIPSYAIMESANNNTHVDSETGIYVEKQEDESWKYIAGPNKNQIFNGTAIGEYDFLISFFNQSVNIETLVIQYIQMNDSIGKYDI